MYRERYRPGEYEVVLYAAGGQPEQEVQTCLSAESRSRDRYKLGCRRRIRAGRGTDLRGGGVPKQGGVQTCLQAEGYGMDRYLPACRQRA